MSFVLISRTFRNFVAMMALISFSASCMPTTPRVEATPIPVPEGWSLIWHDEFDSQKIDPENWTYDLGGWGLGKRRGAILYFSSRKCPS